MTPLRYGLGNVLYVQGDPAEKAYLIRQGGVETHREGPGERAATRRFGPGEVVGLAETLLRIPRFATARVVADAVVHALTPGDMEALLGANPALGLKIITALSAELRSVDAEIERVLGAPPSATPDYRVLSEAAKARGQFAAAAALLDRASAKGGGSSIEAGLEAAEMEAASGRVEAALARLGTLIAEFPDDDRPLALYERIRKGAEAA